MSTTNFTPEQKAIIDCCVNLIERSGCNTSQIIEIFSELTGSLIAYKAPSKEEILGFIENNLMPHTRKVALDKYCIKRLKEEYGDI